MTEAASGSGFQTLMYGTDPSQFIELWGHENAESSPLAVLIHGGYWRDTYGLDLMHPMARHLRGRGWKVANIEYRRLAEPVGSLDGDVEPDPDMWDKMSSDVNAAISLAVAHSGSAVDEGNRDSNSLAVAIGHSAGGQLALWAATQGRLDAVVALAPVADLVSADRLDLSTGVVRRLLGGGSATRESQYRSASPVARLPLGVPQLIVHGAADENVPQDMSLAFHAKAVAAGDQAQLLAGPDVDHFHVIDPAHEVWRPIDGWLGQLLHH